MKIIDVPQTGKCGLTVTFPSRNGLIRRAWVVPSNPQTAEQLVVRGRLASMAAAYDALTESQQNAWIAAAAQIQTRSVLGQSGPMTGLQLFVKINANLAQVGEPTVNAPPDAVTWDANITQSLELTNVSNVVALKLVCSGSSDAFNLVSAAAPQKTGVRSSVKLNYLGELPEVVSGKADITSLYTAKFGAPVAGQRIFVSSQQMLDGWKDIAKAYTGVVPASS